MRILICTILSLNLLACGFHLRGAYPLPPSLQEMHLVLATPNSIFGRYLQRSLDAAGVTLSSQAKSRMIVENVQVQRRVLSLNNEGDAREYELIASVTFSVTENDNVVLERTLSLSRDYLYDSTDVLSAGEEEQMLRTEMQRELARLVMQSLASLSS